MSLVLRHSSVESPNTSLPPNLRLIRDMELTLPVVNEAGETVRDTCGWHWTLYTTTDMSAEDFEALYVLFKGQLIPCEPALKRAAYQRKTMT